MQQITSRQPHIFCHPDKLAAFCDRHGIRQLAFFGSVLRDDFRPDSDVDVLVDFLPDRVPGFLRLHDMQEELSQLLAGRTIDLVTRKSLNSRIQEQVLAEAAIQYAQR
jgi:uncharacterized protein